MKFVRIINENGIFINEDFVEELTPTTIETICSGGFYKPKWDGSKWVEGLTQAEIDVIVNTVKPKTEIEELNDQIVATQMLLIESQSTI